MARTVQKNTYLCSPMNYIGGKYKLLPQILPLFPKKIRVFVDLFCGGANVGMNVKSKKVVFNDNLSYLIDLYRAFQTIPKAEILQHIENRISDLALSMTNEEGYLALRNLYNNQRNPLDLFVLTAYSFNHQIRFNNSHLFNNPFGRDRSSFNNRMRNNLIDFLDKLAVSDASFSCGSFDGFDLSELTEEDFLYCDPPYLITTGTYNDGKRGFSGWNEGEERKLLSLLKTVDENGLRFALSNVLIHKGKTNDMLIEWVYKNKYKLFHLNKNYSNSNYHTIDRGKTASDEVLITNYEPEISQPTLNLCDI